MIADDRRGWRAHIQSDWERAGLSIVWVRDIDGGGRELSNGSTGWIVMVGDRITGDETGPLRLPDEMGRALLAELLRHYNGADDARMLRKDYDAERKRVDLLLEKLSSPIIITGEVVQR